MVTLNAQIIEKNGRKEFAVLPYAEYLKVREELETLDDLRCLREATAAEKDAPAITLAAAKKRWKSKRGK